MKNIWSFVKSLWTSRMLPIWRALSSVLWRLFLVLAILVLFKYLFFTNCLSVQSVKACVTSSLNDTGTFFTLGGLLLALFIMIPTFWIEGKIRDASKEVKQEVLAETQEMMQKLSRAQMLLFEAERMPPNELLNEQLKVEEAVKLWPAFKHSSYRQLGIKMAQVVSNAMQGRTVISTVYTRDDVGWFARYAITYLKETVSEATTPDAEGLLHLASMYGYQQQFDDMMRAIDKAMKVDEEMKEKFREPAILITLLRACGSERTKIEKLEKKINILPVSKNVFCETIRKIDLVDFKGFIKWIAIKRHSATGERGTFIIKITPPYPSNNGLVDATAQRVEGGHSEQIVTVNNLVTIEELYEILFKSFFLICTDERE